MLILGFLLLLVLGFFAASWLALRVLQLITLVAIAMLLAAGMGALIFGGLIGLIAALVLQATLTADYPLLSIAAGLAVALLVTVASLRRIVWEIHAARNPCSKLEAASKSPRNSYPHQKTESNHAHPPRTPNLLLPQVRLAEDHNTPQRCADAR